MGYSGSIRAQRRDFLFEDPRRDMPFHRFQIFPGVNFLNLRQQFTFNPIRLDIIRTA
ncbi:Uncharacterised protein [Enterobacter cloacae]|nr:Uncharacterised protein [Enterobacter cloacae]